MTRDGIETNGVGLVLEGGALRGLFTAGVLDYFMEQGLKFPYIVGVSAGACNLLGYAAHQIHYTKNCMIQKDAKNQYFGVNQLLHAKTIFNLDRVFYEYPYDQLPFDFKTFFNSGIQTEFVVTNCVTGKAEYLYENRDEYRLGTLGKASASVPLFSKMVELDQKKYLDGGITDSKDGRVFVIRPKLPEIKRFETNPDTLEAYYQHGVQVAKSCWKEMQDYLSHAAQISQSTGELAVN